MLCKHPNLFVFNETVAYDHISAHGLHANLMPAQISGLKDHLLRRLDVRTVPSSVVASDLGGAVQASEAKTIRSHFSERIRRLISDDSITAAQVLDCFLSSVAAGTGSRRWGEKTPNHVFHLDSIRQDFADARFLHIVRHPMEFLRSYKFARRRSELHTHIYHPYVTSSIWRRSIKSFLRFREHYESQCFELRYEDLVNNPAHELTKVCNFIGEEFDSAMLRTSSSNSSFSTKTKDTMPDWEVSICNMACGKIASRYDYSLTKTSCDATKATALAAISLPAFAFRAAPRCLKFFDGGIWRYLKARKLLPFAQ